jgi:hypothetical protein
MCDLTCETPVRPSAPPSVSTHFLKLVRLIHKCISWELKRSEVDEIRQGFQDWVLEYEE